MGKVMLMLRCIKRALAIAPTHPQTHKMIVKFFAFVDKKKAGEGLHEYVEKVVEGEREALLKGKKVEEFNEEYLAKAEKLGEVSIFLFYFYFLFVCLCLFVSLFF